MTLIIEKWEKTQNNILKPYYRCFIEHYHQLGYYHIIGKIWFHYNNCNWSDIWCICGSYKESAIIHELHERKFKQACENIKNTRGILGKSFPFLISVHGKY